MALTPCAMCSAMLIQAGVNEVVFKDTYRLAEGLELLKSAGIIVRKFNFRE